MNRYTGHVTAICPTCGQSVHSESAQAKSLSYVRDLVKKIARLLRKQYPFAKVVTVDPLAGVKH